MMTEPQLDPMVALIAELRADTEVVALVGSRIREGEPAPGDVQGSGQFLPFVVLHALDVPPDPRLPITRATYGVRSYGVTGQNAWAVHAAVVRALHGVGPRIANGLGIYQTLVAAGGERSSDPDTKQPVFIATIIVVATTQAVRL